MKLQLLKVIRHIIELAIAFSENPKLDLKYNRIILEIRDILIKHNINEN